MGPSLWRVILRGWLGRGDHSAGPPHHKWSWSGDYSPWALWSFRLHFLGPELLSRTTHLHKAAVERVIVQPLFSHPLNVIIVHFLQYRLLFFPFLLWFAVLFFFDSGMIVSPYWNYIVYDIVSGLGIFLHQKFQDVAGKSLLMVQVLLVLADRGTVSADGGVRPSGIADCWRTGESSFAAGTCN